MTGPFEQTPEGVIAIDTELGPLWFRGRDSGRPVVVKITGAFSEENVFGQSQRAFPAVDFLIVHLPGNHSPPLAETSIAAWAEALSQALATRFAGRPVLLVGLSTGGLVALGTRAANVRRMVVVEPPLLTGDLWPLLPLRAQAPADAQAFIQSVFGIFPDHVEPRDHRWLLDDLQVPAHVLIGDMPLKPRRKIPPLPSLVTA